MTELWRNGGALTEADLTGSAASKPAPAEHGRPYPPSCAPTGSPPWLASTPSSTPGFTVISIAAFLMARLPAHPHYATDLMPRLILFGLGTGLASPAV